MLDPLRSRGGPDRPGRLRILGAAALFALVAGCGTRTPIPDVSSLPTPLVQPTGNIGAAPRIDGRVGRGDTSPPAQTSLGSAPIGLAPSAAQDDGPGDYSLDFADTDIREVAGQILGQMLRVSYTIDPSIRGTATFHTAQPLPRSRLLPTLQVLLSQSGAALVQSGSLYRVVPIAEAATTGTDGADSTAGSLVIPLRYASADSLVKVLQPFVTANARMVADPGRNAVLVSGEPLARNSMVSLIESFDVDQLAGQSYAMLPVTSGDAKDFASAMQEAMRGGANGALAGLVRVIPLERLSAVLVAAQQPRYIEEVRRVYNLVERQRRFTVRTWHVYYLQNSHANDVAYVMQQAFTPKNVTASPPGSNQNGAGGARQASGFQQNNSNGSGSGGGLGGSSGSSGGLGSGSSSGGLGGGLGSSGSSNGTGGGLGGGGLGGGGIGGTLGGAGQGPAGAGGAGGAGGQSNPLLGGLDTNGGSDADTDTMRIIPNVQNNALLVYATPDEDTTISAMLHKIDILPLQVRIDATIAEVTLNDALQYGTQFFFKEGSVNQTLSNASAAAAGNTVSGSFPGFVFAASSKAVNAAISALQNVTTVHVLSSPELLVLDNQPARLLVGQLVPYLTQSSQSTIASGSPVINSVDYRQTGVIMEVTPRVNSGGLVTLDVSQEVSEVDTSVANTDGINSPTFSDRSVVSRVVVQDGQTVGLAGLIQESRSKGNSGIPWLKDVPVLGLLAGTQDNSRTRTELLILITPHVVRDQRDAQALTEDLREQLPNAALLPQEMNTLPLSGSPDPSQRLRQRLYLGP